MVTFTENKTTFREVENRLFSKYHELDDEIIKTASKYDIYLIGGTAIEIWLNHLNIKGWRKRSNNDFDFISYHGNPGIKKFAQFLLDKGLVMENEDLSNIMDFFKLVEDDKVILEVDLMTDASKTTFNFKKTLNGIKLMSPIYLFYSKFDRYAVLDPIKHKDRYEKDSKDLIDILKIIDKLKLDEDLEKALNSENHSDASWDRLDELIETYNKLRK